MSSRSTIVTATAVYSLISALLNFCGAISFMGLRAIGGLLPQLADTADLTAQEQQALAQASALSGLLPIFGALFGVIAILLLVDAVGLFQAKPWSWMLTVGLYGASVVLAVLSWAGGGFSLLSVGTTLIAALIVYLFLTNADVKQTLGRM
ncbi:MAG: hypothetical protein HXY40_01810 [Chloroflexi bacterium]|nr:hypothetical protein [Chloroflexota bacterium]